MKRKPLTTGEVAQYCGVHLRTVSRWIQRGELKAYQLPGRGDNRIQVDDFLEFLKQNDFPIPPELTLTDSQKHILIVEDNPLWVKALQRLLGKAGYHLSVATNGFEAGTMIASELPDLITLDLHMPGLSGMDTLKVIKQNDRLKHIKVIVISAGQDEELRDSFYQGADAVLHKPFDNRQLLDIINHLIG